MIWKLAISLFVTISEKVFLKWYNSAKYRQSCNEALKRAKIAKDLRNSGDLPDDELHFRD